MTRFISYLLILVVLVLLMNNCTFKGRSIVVNDKLTKPKSIVIHHKNLLPKNYYLKNRITECEDRISFMKSMITFTESPVNLLSLDSTLVVNRKIVVGIDFEKNNSKLLDLHHFYFDLECFENQHYNSLLELVLSPDEFMAIDNLINNNPNYKGRFKVCLNPLSCFSFWIDGGRSSRIQWSKSNIN